MQNIIEPPQYEPYSSGSLFERLKHVNYPKTTFYTLTGPLPYFYHIPYMFYTTITCKKNSVYIG